jgi:PhnB protein
MQIQPYLFFGGRCEEAIEFYKSALSAEVKMLMRYKDSPEPAPPGMVPPGYDNKIMHSTLQIGDSTVMAADDCIGHPQQPAGFSLALSPATEAEAQRLFRNLSAGGNVTMPLAKTFFSPAFGMLTDKFGIPWMIHVAGETK